MPQGQAQNNENLEFYGYKRNVFKTVLTYILYLATVGLLRLLFHWYPTWRLYATHSKCSLEIAEKLLLVDHYQGLFKSYFVEEVKWITANDRNEKLIAYLDDGSMKSCYKLRVVWCKKLCYVWDEEKMSFLRLSGFDRGHKCRDYYDYKGFSLREQELRLITYGKNDIEVPVNNIFQLFLGEVLTPFYFFQLFSLVIWFLDQYYYYTIAIIVMSVFGITSAIVQTRKNQHSLHQTIHSFETITAIRGGCFEEVPSYNLVPGDVIEIPKNGCVMHCDAVVVNGTCIVNESMLTGESVPIPKTPIPKINVNYNLKEDSFHTLFCGTKVIQTRSQKNGRVLAVVIRTGFLTSKGELVRNILYPTPTDFKFDQDSYKVIGILTVVAILGSIYTVVSKSGRSISFEYIALKALDLITIVIPPALPAAITVGKLYALNRLKKQDIFCINSRVINVSGMVDCMCFDKTGTLTEDGLDMWGVVPAHENRFHEPIRDVCALPTTSALLRGMAVCQSLTTIEGEVVGDPLDVKMFKATGWSLDEVNSDNEHKRVVTSKCNEHIEVLHQYPFSSSLQRMSVITRSDDGLEVFCKGSPEMISSLSLSHTVPGTLSATLEVFTKKGYRVIAVGTKSGNSMSAEDLGKTERGAVENDLHFVGLVVLENRIKSATSSVIKTLKTAQVRTVMVTGDNIETALSVAKDCGIIECDEIVVTVGVNTSNVEFPFLTFSMNESLKNLYNDESIIQIEKQKCNYAMTGTTWALVKEHFRHTMDEFVRNGVVFARMTGQQKQELIHELKMQGYYTGMCGDGANDCGALKTSHVGISLSEEESSVASPFTSKTPDISCVPKIIKEGRGALTTGTGIFKFMICYSLTQFSSAVILYGIDDNLTALQFLFVDIFIVLNVMSTFGKTKAYEGPLHRIRPSDSLLSLITVSSIIIQLFFVVLFEMASYYIIQTYDWFVPFEFNPNDVLALSSYENYAIYLTSLFQYLIVVVVMSKGKPYRKSIYTNFIFFGDVLLMAAICSYILFYPADWIVSILDLKVPPEYHFNLVLFGLVIVNFVCSWICEDFIVGFLLTRKLHPKVYELFHKKKTTKSCEALDYRFDDLQVTKL